MPYSLRGNCVIKTATGEVVKCHDTHAQAVAHLRALIINVDKSLAYKVIAVLKSFDESKVNRVPKGHSTKRGDRVNSGEFAPKVRYAPYNTPMNIEQAKVALDTFNRNADTNWTLKDLSAFMGIEHGEIMVQDVDASPNRSTLKIAARFIDDEGFVIGSAERVIIAKKLPDGARRLVMTNNTFELKSRSQHKGLGTKTLLRQVKALRKAGFEKIELTASKMQDPDFNGYYTWPRLGFDGAINSMAIQTKAQEDLNIPRPNKVSEIMQLGKRGADWWKANGHTILADFDLNPKSLSSRVLAAYQKEKGLTLRAELIDLLPEDEAILDRVWERIGSPLVQRAWTSDKHPRNEHGEFATTGNRRELFAAQNRLVEAQPKHMQNRAYGKALEHAGDIFRELTMRDEVEPYSKGYIDEKMRRLRYMLTDDEFNHPLSAEDERLADSMKSGWNQIGHSSELDKQARELALLVLHRQPALSKLSEFETNIGKFFGGK